MRAWQKEPIPGMPCKQPWMEERTRGASQKYVVSAIMFLSWFPLDYASQPHRSHLKQMRDSMKCEYKYFNGFTCEERRGAPCKGERNHHWLNWKDTQSCQRKKFRVLEYLYLDGHDYWRLLVPCTLILAKSVPCIVCAPITFSICILSLSVINILQFLLSLTFWKATTDPK